MAIVPIMLYDAMQSSAVSPWLLKLGIRRELGLYADTVAKRGAHYFFYAWELPDEVDAALADAAASLGGAEFNHEMEP